jgi:hypothetical protein
MLELRKNEEKYYNFIRILRNDPTNQKGFLDKVNISENDQKLYMDKYGDCYYVCLKDEIPCGYIGVVENDIRICVDNSFKKLGVGKFMLSEVVKIFPDAKAKILKTNTASLNLFIKTGFNVVSNDNNLFYLEYGIQKT